MKRRLPPHFTAWHGRPHAPPRFLVRVRFHLFLSRRHAYRAAGASRGRRGALAALFARTDLQGAGNGNLAIQPLSVEGQIYVARYGALVRTLEASEIRAASRFSRPSALGVWDRDRG